MYNKGEELELAGYGQRARSELEGWSHEAGWGSASNSI